MKDHRRGAVLIAAVVAVLTFAGCSDNGEAVTPAGDSGTSESSETTAAPETTTTAAPESADSATDASSTTSETSNDTAWGIVILIALVLIGLIAWAASRSGAQRGAQEQAQRDAYGEGAPPPPPAE